MIYDMNLKSDMLSVRKEKLHGMSEPRWTTRDKMTQYKGLINLYKRDKKIAYGDRSIAHKRDKDVVSVLKKQLATSRSQLDNAVFGDRQNIRNALADDRRLQLAYQDLPTEKIIEHIHQDNFNYRKQLDLVNYRKQEKAKHLVNLKLLVAELEDRVIYDAPGNLPIEIECQRLTAFVQDAILKKEAAIVINDAYKKIVFVCRKDARYFDTILESLRLDREKQGKCMLSAIILGQLAIEYLDDRRKEFRLLESTVKDDMSQRQKELSEIQTNVKSSSKHLKFYIRRDSEILLPLANVDANVDLETEVKNVCDILDTLKTAFVVANCTELLNSLQEQFRQADRLQELFEKCLEKRDILQNKIEHANIIYNDLLHTMVDTTKGYLEKKRYLKSEIVNKISKTDRCNYLHQKTCHLLAKIKASLQNLEQTCKYVREPVGGKKVLPVYFTSEEIEREKIKEVINIKATSQEIMGVLTPKLLYLSTHAVPITDDFTRDLAYIKMEDLVSNRTKPVEVEEETIYESLIEITCLFDEPGVPSRAEIKTRSNQIVIANSVNEDLIPVFDSRSRRKWKLK